MVRFIRFRFVVGFTFPKINRRGRARPIPVENVPRYQARGVNIFENFTVAPPPLIYSSKAFLTKLRKEALQR